ncbi:hypothetical protein [Amycolatopsis thailandensis]|uniref:hypothetical protein n=1 Tax=Amycolatopsis thailandensis TaxID=589330 RepID=UPI00362B4085
MAHHALAPNGLLLRRDNLSQKDQHPRIDLVRTKDFSLPVTYDSHTARDTATQLLGYARQFYTQSPLPRTLSVDLLDPTSHNATTSTWSLGPGLDLCYHAPFDATLDTEHDTWELTPALATRWGRALLTLAVVLDHARAVATHAVLADRCGARTIDNLRDWTNKKIEDGDNHDHFPILCEFDRALREEDVFDRLHTLIAVVDIANPDLPTTLTALRLNAAETLTHLDAAKAIGHIADRYGIPLFMWTEEHWWIARNHLSVGELTEAEWRRFTSTPEVQDFPLHVEQRQLDGHGIDFELALQQAGLSCRECSRRIHGEITETYGHCAACLPADRTAALTEALERGCPAEPFNRGVASHSGTPGESCLVCGLPLPAPGDDSGDQR